MPKVSIIMPTYNRADTIQRAIKSVQAQSFGDWELIVVDDGSTDDTLSLIDKLEPRMNLIRQANRGFVEARNTGLRAGTGEYLAFLDSDDEWLPNHLDLCIAFLENHAEEQFIATELIEDFGGGKHVNHYRVETSDWYPGMAKKIRSHTIDRPPGAADDYLRFYESRTPIGAWAEQVHGRAEIGEDAFVYSGRIFERLRWGYLIAVNSLVLRRSVLAIIGLEDPSYNYAADYCFVAKLCLQFRANFLSVPTYIKHELNSDGALPSEGHIAAAFVCAKDMLRSFEDLFWRDRQDDHELCALRGLWQFSLAQSALQFGQRDIALEHLKGARRSLPRFWNAIALELFVRCLPQPELSRKAWDALTKGSYASRQLFRGQLSLGTFLRKALAKVN